MERNNLYPIFLKVHQLETLIVGGGNVALEKLTFLLKSSPHANVTMVAKSFLSEIRALAIQYDVNLIDLAYDRSFLVDKHIVIAATDHAAVNKQIHHDAKSKHLLVNVADTPKLCDFYLGGIVTKGNVKIAISTNGKSPTMAKRLRQFFEQVLPEEIDKLAINLNKYRNDIKGDFNQKVKELNALTKDLIIEKEKLPK